MSWRAALQQPLLVSQPCNWGSDFFMGMKHGLKTRRDASLHGCRNEDAFNLSRVKQRNILFSAHFCTSLAALKLADGNLSESTNYMLFPGSVLHWGNMSMSLWMAWHGKP
ncbi:hypothetical protein H112_05085 [Trichophyton rubrum D6]|uniref:Uncharacterized protein n=3 Tax=Trichophyton TaxID=5550 RepID=A0A080WHX6_TRIRC|nr:uncharacterized protein TERG_11909 [Trichophyton rubrum CBS 118892]EZF21915.1 hypothetical protein H100_05109 [Trichophyton rubrum MR850]EZF41085.1 hypothetical protein H102_05094 [Trichophyton rubrum CBS 100081]EZF51591.1 hypothetical protein H103_05096 [Trichophyton rubrum CBS 288.86]EZF62337.1 hypothetical protein H104_05090 [Trichophyton rubrum CBS 289.86]EZF72836.1 hypothetical protein H105_05116 [Trichophyton soudanense CBS 452.61]EZF83551.1 hypothetical protein H110_05095 [Trichophy